MRNDLKSYKRKLRKALSCSWADKRRLLGKFEKTLELLQEETANPSMQELEAAFGTPCLMAESLLTEIPGDKRRKHRICMRIVNYSAIAIFAAMVIGGMLYLHQRAITMPDTIYIEDVIYDYGAVPCDDGPNN